MYLDAYVRTLHENSIIHFIANYIAACLAVISFAYDYVTGQPMTSYRTDRLPTLCEKQPTVLPIEYQ